MNLITFLADDDRAEPVTIQCMRAVPRCETLAEQDKLFHHAGLELERVLCGALPGGLYDALLRAMLRRRASLLTRGISSQSLKGMSA